MSRTAVLSDIHGNLPALEAVIADAEAEGCARFLNLGDCLSGPLWPAETADLLIARGWPTIAGNHERQLAAPLEGMGASDAFAAAALSARHWEWLGSLPAGAVVDGMGLCHGTPSDDTAHLLFTVSPAGIAPASDAEIAARGGSAEQAITWCGHSHIPASRTIGGKRFVNPGSVGLQAFDDDRPYPYSVENCDPRARYAIVDAGIVSLRAIPYDHPKSARKAASEGFADWARWLATGSR